jgi:hypothetical protein
LPAAEKAPELYSATVSWLEEQVEIAVEANAAVDSVNVSVPAKPKSGNTAIKTRNRAPL